MKVSSTKSRGRSSLVAACVVGFALAATQAAACGGDGGTNGGGPGPGVDGGDGASPSVDGGGADSPSATDSGDAGTGPTIPLPTACSAPSVTSTVLVGDAGAAGIRSATVAWSGSEAAIAYVERTSASGAGSVFLQRTDHTGKPLSAPILLAQDKTPVNFAPVAVASDGASFVVCWNEASGGVSVSCASVPVGGSTSTLGYSHAGVSVFGVASDGTGFLLLTQSGSTPPPSSLEQLDTNAAGVGNTSVGSSLYRVLAARPAALGGGYVVADAEGGKNVYWQDIPPPGGPAGGGALDGGAFVSGLAAGDKTELAFVSALGGATASLLPLAPGAAAVPIESSFGGLGALATGAAGFAAVWRQSTGGVRYLPLSAAGAAAGSIVDLALKATNSALSLTAVDDGFLLVTSTDGASATTLTATHLGCP